MAALVRGVVACRTRRAALRRSEAGANARVVDCQQRRATVVRKNLAEARALEHVMGNNLGIVADATTNLSRRACRGRVLGPSDVDAPARVGLPSANADFGPAGARWPGWRQLVLRDGRR